MLTFEKRIVKMIEQYKDILFFAIITFLGVAIRFLGRDFISKDMVIFLRPWFDIIKSQGGLNGLSTQVGDYNIPYQAIISFFTYMNINPVYLYKMLSCVFDFLLAYYSAVFICELSLKPKYGFTFNISYFLILLLPTVVFNSSFWGQCDAIYVFFCVLTLRNLYKEKYLAAFVFLGIAFAFKLQTIFIFPFIVCYYFYKKNFSILYFLVTAFVFELSGIPGFLAGRSLTAPWDIYLYQTQEQPIMYANISNFWVLISDDYDALGKFAILLTICILGMGLYLILSKKKELLDSENFLNFCCWIVWTCVLFLPVMHERYTYGLDILLIMLCFIHKIYIPFAVISGMLSLLTYSYFLFDTAYMEKLAALIFMVAYLIYSYVIFGRRLKQK